MAEFNDPGIPMDTKTPDFNLATPLLDAQKIQSNATAQQSALANLSVQKTQTNNALIADAARKSLADPQNADSYFQSAAQNGATGASQYVGRTNPFLLTRLSEAYGNSEPSQDLTVGSGAQASPLAAARAPAEGSNTTESPTAALDARFANVPPEQMATTLQHYNAAQNSLIAVMRSNNPAQEWDNQLATLKANGVPVPPGLGSYSPLLVQQLYQQVSGMQGYLQQRVTAQSMGAPAPLPAVQTMAVPADSRVIQVNPYGQTGPANEVSGATRYQPVPYETDAKGNPLTFDRNTGTYTAATNIGPVNRQPTGGGLTFQVKYQAALANGMTPDAALQFANGKGALTPQQNQDAAVKMANSDYNTLIANQTPPPEGYAAFIKNRAGAIVQTLQTGAPPAAAQARPQGGTPVAPTPVQHPPVPTPLATIPGLQYNPARNQFKNPQTGAIYNANGQLVSAASAGGR